MIAGYATHDREMVADLGYCRQPDHPLVRHMKCPTDHGRFWTSVTSRMGLCAWPFSSARRTQSGALPTGDSAAVPLSPDGDCAAMYRYEGFDGGRDRRTRHAGQFAVMVQPVNCRSGESSAVARVRVGSGTLGTLKHVSGLAVNRQRPGWSNPQKSWRTRKSGTGLSSGSEAWRYQNRPGRKPDQSEIEDDFKFASHEDAQSTGCRMGRQWIVQTN